CPCSCPSLWNSSLACREKSQPSPPMLSTVTSAATHLSTHVENQTPRQDSGAKLIIRAQTPEAPNPRKEMILAHLLRRNIPMAPRVAIPQRAAKNFSSQL